MVEQPSAAGIIGELTAARAVTQEFLCPAAELCGVELKMATFARRNSGAMVFSLAECRPRAAGEERVVRSDMGLVHDNQYHRFSFAPIASSMGRRYRMRLHCPDAGAGNAVTAYWDPDDPYPDGSVELDGGIRQGDLAFRALVRANFRDQGAQALRSMATDSPLTGIASLATLMLLLAALSILAAGYIIAAEPPA
ncbi:hypothetical protein JW905_05100 [bacterium]|nr:hypothetical protein [candidate division CSSED10-310 bacterium]